MRPIPSFFKSIFIALLVSTAACHRDAVSPEQAAMARGGVMQDREHADEGPAVGNVTTFEDFAPGAIDGQFGWQSIGGVGSLIGSEHGVYDHEIVDLQTLNLGRYLSQSFGRRSLRISNAVTSGAYSDQTFSSRTANVAGESTSLAAGAVRNNHFEAEWTLLSAVPGALQAGLEVVASPSLGNDVRMSWVQMADLPDGLAIVFAEWSDPALFSPSAWRRTTVARRLDRREAHTIKITMDFVDGPDNDVVRVYVDGELRQTGASWENYYAFRPTAPQAVNRMMFRTGSDLRRGIPGDPAPLTLGHGFVIDNLRQATFMVARSADACRSGGWLGLREADGGAFEDEDDCVAWVRHTLRRGDHER